MFRRTLATSTKSERTFPESTTPARNWRWAWPGASSRVGERMVKWGSPTACEAKVRTAGAGNQASNTRRDRLCSAAEWPGMVPPFLALEERGWRLDTALEGGVVTRSLGHAYRLFSRWYRRSRYARTVQPLFRSQPFFRPEGRSLTAASAADPSVSLILAEIVPGRLAWTHPEAIASIIARRECLCDMNLRRKGHIR